VFLTGGTGWQGAALMYELLCSTGAVVHCLVRAGLQTEAVYRIRESLRVHGYWRSEFEDRIVPVRGDLSLPLLGLRSTEFAALARSIDEIWHCGERRGARPYEELRPANVSGTGEIVRLAFASQGGRLNLLSPAAATSAAVRAGSGYLRSKQAAEHIVLEGMVRGLAAAIYRLGDVAGSSSTGRWEHVDDLRHFLISCLRLGAVPWFDGALDILPIDQVSADLVRRSRRPQSFSVVHRVVNARPARHDDLVQALRMHGCEVRTVPLERWVRAACDTGLDAMGVLNFGEWARARLHPDRLTVSARPGAAEPVESTPADSALLGRYIGWLRDKSLVPPLCTGHTACVLEEAPPLLGRGERQAG
jgi:thioester reductase-like protein